MGFLFVQTKQNSSGGTSSLVITLDAPATANNVLVVNIKILNGSVTVTSVTDNASSPNTYANAVGPIDNGIRTYQYYGVQVTGGATTVTVNLSGSIAVRVDVDEFNGGALTNAAIFDNSSSGNGTGTSATVTSFNIARVGALISASVSPVSTITTPVAGANYTLGQNQANLPSQYRLSSSTSETAPISWTNSSQWAEVAASYLPLTTTTSKANSVKACFADFRQPALPTKVSGFNINCLDYQIVTKSDGWNQDQTKRLNEFQEFKNLLDNPASAFVALAVPYDNLTKYTNYVADARTKGFKIWHRSHWNAWQGDNGVGDIATPTSLTRSGSTATCVTNTAHGLSTGDTVSMNGMNETDYRGEFVVTVTNSTTFTYTVANSPATPATGNIGWRFGRATYLRKTRQFIIDNPTLFAAGDMFGMCVEADQADSTNMTFKTPGTTNFNTALYNKFQIDQVSFANDAFTAISLSQQVHTWPISQQLSNLNLNGQTLDSGNTGNASGLGNADIVTYFGGYLATDHYMSDAYRAGSSYGTKYASDLDKIHTAFPGAQIMIGEWGFMTVTLLESTSTGSNSSTTLNDTTKSWTTNQWQNADVTITGGTGSGQTRNISSNTTTQLTITPSWSTTPDATSQYQIYVGQAEQKTVYDEVVDTAMRVKTYIIGVNFWNHMGQLQSSLWTDSSGTVVAGGKQAVSAVKRAFNFLVDATRNVSVKANIRVNNNLKAISVKANIRVNNKTKANSVIANFLASGYAQDFVSVSGGNLMRLGRRYRYDGINFYPLLHFTLGQSDIDTLLNYAYADGVRVIRAWCFDAGYLPGNSAANYRYLEYPVGTNLLSNGNFETDTTGWTVGSDFTRVSNDAYDSDYSMKQVSTSGYSGIQAGFTTTTNTSYVVTFYYKVSNPSGNPPVLFIGTTPGDNDVLDAGYNSGTSGLWARRQVQFNSGSNTTVYLSFQNWGGSVTAYYDDINVSVQGTPIFKWREATLQNLDLVLDRFRRKGMKVMLSLADNPTYHTKETYIRWSDLIYGTTYYSPVTHTIGAGNLSRVGTTVTCTTPIAHGYYTGNLVTIAGAVEAGFNGNVWITVTGASTFTYVSGTSGTTTATGTITVVRDVTPQAFFDDANCRQMYKDFVDKLTQRVNSINGIPYKNDDTIFSWELGNEMRYDQNNDPNINGPTSKNLAALGGTGGWADIQSTYIKTKDSNHLVGFGDLAHAQPYTTNDTIYNGTYYGIDYETTGNLTNIDYYDIHLYPYQYDNQNLRTPTGYWGIRLGYSQLTSAGFVAQIEELVAIAKSHSKPLLVTEIGIVKSNVQAAQYPAYPRSLFGQNFSDLFYGEGGDGINWWHYSPFTDNENYNIYPVGPHTGGNANGNDNDTDDPAFRRIMINYQALFDSCDNSVKANFQAYTTYSKGISVKANFTGMQRNSVKSDIFKTVLQGPLIYQGFSGVTIPSGFVQTGNSTWTYNGSTAAETTVGSGDPNKILYTAQDFPINRTVIAKLRIVALGTNDDRIGISVLSQSSNGYGLNLTLRESTRLMFLNDQVAWSPTEVAIAPIVGEDWWFKAQYEKGIIYGKAWKDGTSEPAFMVNWTITMGAAYKYAGLVGNSLSKTSKATYDEFEIYADGQVLEGSQVKASIPGTVGNFVKADIKAIVAQANSVKTNFLVRDVNWYGTALKFDGSQNYVLVKSGRILSGLTNWWIDITFKRANTSINSSGEALYAERAGSGNDILKVDLFGDSGNIGKVGLTYRDTAGTLTQIRTTTTYNDGVTHRMTISKIGTAIVITVDGVQTPGTLTAGDTFTNSGVESRIGSDRGDGGAYFEGIIDDLQLGASSQSIIYGLYPLDEGTGLTATDGSGAGNNGTLSGSPVPYWVYGLDELAQQVKASVVVTNTKNVSVKANIRVNNNTQNINVKADILAIVSQANSVKARILGIVPNSVKANILVYTGYVNLLSEDMQSTPSGTLKGTATYDSTNKWVQLINSQGGTSGQLEYSSSILKTKSFVVNYPWRVTGSADGQVFYWGCSSTAVNHGSVSGGYAVVQDFFNNTLRIAFNGSQLTTATLNIAGSIFQNVNIEVHYDIGSTTIIVTVGGVQKISFTDSVRTLGGSLYGFGAYTGGQTSVQRIQGINVELLGKDNTPKANIRVNNNTQNNSVKASVVVTNLVGNSAKANIRVNNNTQNNNVKADILVPNNVQGNSVKLNILSTGTLQANNVKANIRVNNNTQNNNVKSDFLVQNNTQSNNVKSSIVVSNPKGNSTKADILVINNVVENNVKANVRVNNNIQNNSVKSNFLVSNNVSGTSVKANIQPKMMATVKANILVVDVKPNTGPAMYFNGTNAKLAFGNVLTSQSVVTTAIRFQVHSTPSTNFDIVFGYGNTRWFFIFNGASTKLAFNVRAGAGEQSSGYPTTGLTLSKFYTAIGTYDPNAGANNITIRVYDDGGALFYTQTNTGTGAFTATGYPLEIAHDPNRNFFCNITADDAYIYSRVLSIAEQDNLVVGAAPTSGLVGRWVMDEGTGTNIADTSGNGNNGTSINTGWAERGAPVPNAVMANISPKVVSFVKANILVIDTIQENSVKADILAVLTQSNSVKADIIVTNSKDVLVKSSILVNNNTQGANVKANILVFNNVQGNSVKARIPGTVSNAVKADILVYHGYVNLLSENMQSTPAGTLKGTATYDLANQWVQLINSQGNSNGQLEYSSSILKTKSFIVNYPWYKTGAADAQTFYWGASATTVSRGSVTGGYLVELDFFNNVVRIVFNGSELTNAPLGSVSGAFQRVNIEVNYDIGSTRITVSVGGNQKVSYVDSVRTLAGNLYGFGAWTGGQVSVQRIGGINIELIGKDNTVKANISPKQVNNVKADIIVVTSQANSVKADIFDVYSRVNSIKSNILVVNNKQANSIKADFLVINNIVNNSARANITLNNLTRNVFIKANIVVRDNTVDNSVKMNMSPKQMNFVRASIRIAIIYTPKASPYGPKRYPYTPKPSYL